MGKHWKKNTALFHTFIFMENADRIHVFSVLVHMLKGHSTSFTHVVQFPDIRRTVQLVKTVVASERCY